MANTTSPALTLEGVQVKRPENRALLAVNAFWAILLRDITVTGRDGRVSQLDQVYIRGSMIRFFIVPDMLQNAPMCVFFLLAAFVPKGRTWGNAGGERTDAGEYGASGSGTGGFASGDGGGGTAAGCQGGSGGNCGGHGGSGC